jgi:hypothetical protein
MHDHSAQNLGTAQPLDYIERDDCAHPRRVALRVPASSGGLQVRYYCTLCWRAGRALPHADVAARGVPAIDAERAVLDAARDAFWRRRAMLARWSA